MIKTKQELLNHFSDINAMYNNPFMYQTLSNMIDELLEQQLCEDAISREKAIKQCGFGMTSLLIADCLKRLPSVTPSYNSVKTELEQTRWIPVSERLPEKLGTYLATIEIGEMSVLTFVDLCDRGRGERRFDCGTVTAWMPLPQPYTESEDAE